MGNLAASAAGWVQVLGEPGVFWLQEWVEPWEGDGRAPREMWGPIGSGVSFPRLRSMAVFCLHGGALSFSALFPDVVNCMQTDNLELKKLVYLYLMNYAKSQPDMAIMAVNTFVKVRGEGCVPESRMLQRVGSADHVHPCFHARPPH